MLLDWVYALILNTATFPLSPPQQIPSSWMPEAKPLVIDKIIFIDFIAILQNLSKFLLDKLFKICEQQINLILTKLISIVISNCNLNYLCFSLSFTTKFVFFPAK